MIKAILDNMSIVDTRLPYPDKANTIFIYGVTLTYLEVTQINTFNQVNNYAIDVM